jgi:hypothetical protein
MHPRSAASGLLASSSVAFGEDEPGGLSSLYAMFRPQRITFNEMQPFHRPRQYGCVQSDLPGAWLTVIAYRKNDCIARLTQSDR